LSGDLIALFKPMLKQILSRFSPSHFLPFSLLLPTIFPILTFSVNKENTIMQSLNFSIIQEIKHQGICDASAATALGENKFDSLDLFLSRVGKSPENH